MMSALHRSALRLVSLSGAVLLGGAALEQVHAVEPVPTARMDERHRGFFKAYCTECHSAEKQKGKLRLDDVSFVLDSVENADRWQKILNQVNSGEMPPEDAKQPERDEKAAFLEALSGTLVTARKTLGDVQGNITMRRLNRREYRNTLRDLLGVEVRVNDLPADGGAGTFDTVGSSLFMSSDQFEQYLTLGRQALDEHFARILPPQATAKVERNLLRKDPEEWANKYMPIYAKGYAEKYERFQKWCAGIDAAAARPENAEAVERLRMDPRLKTQPHLFYNGFAKITGAPSPMEFGFRDVDDAQFARSEYSYHFRYHADYQNLPARATGSWLMLYSLGRYTGIAAPAKWPPGKYTLRMRVATADDAPLARRFIEIGTGKADAADFNVLSSHQVTGTLADPQVIEIPVEVNATGDRNFAIRDKRPNKREAEYAMFREAWDKTGTGPKPCIWVDFVELDGPVNVAAGNGLDVAKAQKFRVEPETQANREVSASEQAFEKSMERYNRWKAAVDDAAALPENAVLAGEIRELPRVKAHSPAFYQFWAKRSATPSPKDFGFPDGDEAEFQRGQYRKVNYVKDYLALPHRDRGAYLLVSQVHPMEKISAPASWPAGDYVVRVRIGVVADSPTERRFLQFGQMNGATRSFSPHSAHQITGTVEQPMTLEIPVTLTASGDRTFAFREKTDIKGEIAYAMWAETDIKTGGHGPKPALWIDWMEMEGPTPRPSVAKVERIEPEKRRAEVERGHLRFKYLNEQYAKWQEAGGDEKRLKEFDFTDKSHADFAKFVWEQNNRWFQQYLDRPLSKTGLYLDNTVQETCEYAVDLPTDAASGDYVMRVKVGRLPETPVERSFLTLVEASPIDKDDRTFLANRQIAAAIEAPEVVEFPFKVRAGGARKFVLMEKRPLRKEGISLPGRTRQLKDARDRDPALWIDWIEYEGPIVKPEAASGTQSILLSKAQNVSERDQAREVLESFAKRAFRGKVASSEYVEKLVALYDANRAAGQAYATAMKEPLSVILASPGFLYLQETGPAEAGGGTGMARGKSRVLAPLETASRLSYFLWSAPPDEPLLRADLHEAEVMRAEVVRMISSRKVDEFVSGFLHQWLDMQRLDFFQFDTKQFRDFDESARAAARREVYETFGQLLRSGESLVKLLKSDEVFINGLLANYYGIEGVSGDEFQRVRLTADSPRGGLLGMAAILAMGSNGERTSPVERGAWVLRKLLHSPPPPAPPNVPQLSRLEGKLIPTRERMKAHQEEPQCAQCHRKIDPIGFGLENFNAAGKWRAEETYEKRGVGKKTWPINPAGAFHNGPKFADYFELRDCIAAEGDAFARGFTEALIEYALGRPFGFTDEQMAQDILGKAKARNYEIREFVLALATHPRFLMK